MNLRSLRPALGGLAGAACGYAYYRLLGCRGG